MRPQTAHQLPQRPRCHSTQTRTLRDRLKSKFLLSSYRLTSWRSPSRFHLKRLPARSVTFPGADADG
eukprot:15859953-Heterocapsa_arctica.AAC.1